MAGARSAMAEANTIPGAPASVVGLAALYEDADFKAFFEQVGRARRGLPEWDQLAHVRAFAAAAERGRELMARYPGSQERRALAHLLWLLLPARFRQRPHLPLPDEVARRAEDGFALIPGDMPRVAAPYVAFLADPELLTRALAPRAQGPLVLVPRSQARALHPKAPAALVQVVRVEEGLVQGHAPGDPTEVARPTSVDTVATWLLSAGPDARGLDLRSEDDRALLLTWAQLLRERFVDGRSAFAWLQDGNAPAAARARVVDVCIDAAVSAVGTHTLDPFACRIALASHDHDGGWPEEASRCLRAVQLDDGPLVREVMARAPAAGFAAELLWADAILGAPGFAGGRLSAVAAGRAFARLATSVLAPLGVLPLSGLRDGQGSVVLQRLVEEAPGEVVLRAPRVVSFGASVDDEPLLDAWRAGRALLLPDPKGGPRHDLAAMPAWLSLFLEGIDEGFTSRPPQPAEHGSTP